MTKKKLWRRLATAIVALVISCSLLPSASAETRYRLKEEINGNGRSLYQYDFEGRIARKIEYDYKNEPYLIDDYIYSKDGLLAEIRESDPYGKVLDFHYDSNGTQIEFETWGIGGELYWAADAPPFEQKDERGRIVYLKQYGSYWGEDLDGEFYYTYDDLGRILSFETHARRDDFSYYSDGSFIRTTTILRTNEKISTEKYDSKGNLIEKDDLYATKWRYVYNSEGLEIERYSQYYDDIGESLAYSFQYEYDSHGNVKSKTVFDSTGEKMYSIEYRYEQY